MTTGIDRNKGSLEN